MGYEGQAGLTWEAVGIRQRQWGSTGRRYSVGATLGDSSRRKLERTELQTLPGKKSQIIDS